MQCSVQMFLKLHSQLVIVKNSSSDLLVLELMQKCCECIYIMLHYISVIWNGFCFELCIMEARQLAHSCKNLQVVLLWLTGNGSL